MDLDLYSLGAALCLLVGLACFARARLLVIAKSPQWRAWMAGVLACGEVALLLYSHESPICGSLSLIAAGLTFQTVATVLFVREVRSNSDAKMILSFRTVHVATFACLCVPAWAATGLAEKMHWPMPIVIVYFAVSIVAGIVAVFVAAIYRYR